MIDRATEIAGFLAQSAWSNAGMTPMAADFSPRRYARLGRHDGTSAIFMDADADQKTAQFVDIARILKLCDISSPEILAADTARGLVLMEDFGTRNFGAIIDGGANAALLYRRAVDVLIQLHRAFHRDMAQDAVLPVFDMELFTRQVELFLDAYIPYVHHREATGEERDGFRDAWLDTLKPVSALPQSLMLRDFMPDNLMDLPDRATWRSTGVLDFQDGGLGPIAYDLSSLCETVRRDGGDGLMDEMIDYYHAQAKPPVSESDLRSACRILAVQRHMRILGPQWTRMIDARRKQAWFVRITRYLAHLLKDDALKPVRLWTAQHRIFTADEVT